VQGHSEQSKQGVYAAEVHGAVCVSPAAQAVQALHTASLAKPQGTSAYSVARHTVQAVHWGKPGPIQGPEWYAPAGQLGHALHSRSLAVVHAVDS
jgi:hypothetical protein